jgi:hypothetical protein
MGTTTFSGPIKAGTIKETTGTTLGVNIKNTGQVVMAQTTDFSTAGGAQTATVTDIVIPAASQIIDIVIDVPVAVAKRNLRTEHWRHCWWQRYFYKPIFNYCRFWCRS